jgi:hypothetical protein
MQSDLNKLSSDVKEQGLELLKKTKLLDSLSEFGNVFVRGSYELDLMIDGDIDIYLVNNLINEENTLEVLNKLIKEGNFDGYLYYNYVKKPKSFFPIGYYIGLKTNYNGKKWKIDLWLMNEMHKQSEDVFKKVRKNLNEKNKNTILKLKYQVRKKQLNIPSHWIYLAVIDKNINSFSEFKHYLATSKDFSV